MNLGIDIERELWEAIKKNYEDQNYSNAILDGMHLLTETIRNRTGLEGDGASLVGQAFGGDNPRIQLNKLQTDSEKDMQKGTMEILKGLYTAIRNPRTHDRLKDTKQEADAIIAFIDYQLRAINKSKISFNKDDFINKSVLDKHFVKSEEYSNLLISEIPKRQRADIAISVILKRKEGNINNLAFFMTSLFEKLEEPEITRIYKVISSELKHAELAVDIRTILHICPPTYWGKIDKVVKIRIETLLLEDVKAARYDEEEDRIVEIYDGEEDCISELGALGAWIKKEHIALFEDKHMWTKTIVIKLEDGDAEQRAYVHKYFWGKICAINRDKIDFFLENYIREGLQNKDMDIVNRLESEIEYDKDHPWWKIFEEELKEYPNIKYCDLPDWF